MNQDPLWYKDAVFYELYLRAFADGNGDGHGDFAGLATKLDYLQELGVDCIWLLPMYASPLFDDGYDRHTGGGHAHQRAVPAAGRRPGRAPLR